MKRDHTGIQQTFVHDDTHHLESNAWGAVDESTKKMAKHPLDKCVGKHERHPGACLNSNNLVSSHPRTSPDKRTTSANTEGADGHMPALCNEGRPST
jgi:hypothetical protein